MEDYQRIYHRLFNTMTDLAQDARVMIEKMELAQQECEEILLEAVDEREKQVAGPVVFPGS